jgi:hypothetical protein
LRQRFSLALEQVVVDESRRQHVGKSLEKGTHIH